jgi:hypothetical protein
MNGFGVSLQFLKLDPFFNFNVRKNCHKNIFFTRPGSWEEERYLPGKIENTNYFITLLLPAWSGSVRVRQPARVAGQCKEGRFAMVDDASGHGPADWD